MSKEDNVKTLQQKIEELKKSLKKKGDKGELIDKDGYKIKIEKV